MDFPFPLPEWEFLYAVDSVSPMMLSSIYPSLVELHCTEEMSADHKGLVALKYNLYHICKTKKP